MLRVMAIDPGLARCGVVVGETDGSRHRLLSSSLWSTDADVEHRSKLVADDRVHRARELRDLAASQLRTWTPNVVVIEEFGFLQGQHATACLAMAYMTLVCEIDRAHVPLLGCSAREARSQLAPLRGKRVRTSTVGLSKTHAKMVRRQDQKSNRDRTVAREQKAHLEAQRMIEESAAIQVRFNKTQAPHVLDALVLLAWAVRHPFVQSMHFTERPKFTGTFGRASAS